MNDQPQNPNGPYGQHDPYGSRPGDPHAQPPQHPQHQPPYDAHHAHGAGAHGAGAHGTGAHAAGPHGAHDPYAQQAQQPVHPGPQGANWPRPGAPGGQHMPEDPQTQTWRGPTYQDSGQYQHLPPYQQQPQGPGPLPPEQPAPHHPPMPGHPHAAGPGAPGPLRAAGHPQAPGYAQAPGRTHAPGHAPAPGHPQAQGHAPHPSAQPQAPGHAPAPGPGHPAATWEHSDSKGGGTGVGAGAGGAPAATAAPVLPTPSDASLTPAQRARAEGRSPIIPPGMEPALLTAALSALLALAALVHGPFGPFALAVPVVLLQALTAAGWYRLNGMWPARQGIALAFAGGLATDIALLSTARQYAPTVALGTLGVWCLLVLVLQLRNHSSADERLYALTAGIASSAFTVLAAGHLAAVDVSSDAVVVGAAAVAVATLTRALGLPPYVSPAAALVAAAGVGIVAGGATGVGGAAAALLGAVAGGCALIGLRVASYDYPSRFVHLTAGVALPLAVAAPAVYVLGRALG
ncbi:hypothetical protein [Streptomyces sp. NPDC047108]|uniref:hypothetical protein n=1 Tax=Streptomyces sp. NPDC047108 TaxID=3155025 RepID=UPI003404F6D9